LQLHIVTLFTILIIISGSSLGWYSYSQLSKSMINPGKALFNDSSTNVVKKIRSESDHLRIMLKILCASNLTTISNKKAKIAALPVLSEMLKGTSSLSALFVAYPNDDFSYIKKFPINLS
jgi:hypothetical protein